MAGVRQDPLAVGLRQSRPDLLHDRPLAGRTGTAAVFHGRIRGYVGQRFLGRDNAAGCAARQGCCVHLLRDLHTVEHYKKGGPHWPEFSKKWWRLVGDAICLGHQKPDLPAENFDSRRQRIGTPGRTDCRHLAGLCRPSGWSKGCGDIVPTSSPSSTKREFPLTIIWRSELSGRQ